MADFFVNLGFIRDPGRLKITLYFFAKNSSNTIYIEPDAVFSFASQSTETCVNLKTGRIEVKYLNDQINNLEVESNLAVIFSIAVLHVLLQPKPAAYTNKQKTVKIKNGNTIKKFTINPYYLPSTDGKKSASLSNNINSYVLLSSIGYYDLISTQCFYNYYFGKSNYHDHHDSQELHENNNYHDHTNSNIEINYKSNTVKENHTNN